MASFADHFSALAARYATYRPRYPPEVAGALADACARHDVAWDIGCGSGQLSVALATRFSRVIASDPAKAQLDHAERDPRVEYRCVPAEASGLPGASVDLAVAAQAAHWFDWPRFLVEVGRVVRPGGVVALVTYRDAELTGEDHRILLAYYHDVHPYWPPGRMHVNQSYRDLVLPWPAIAAPPVEMTTRWTREELLGYVSTWSATSRFAAAHGGARFDQLARDLAAVWPDGEPRTVHWPLTIKLARR